MGMLLIQTGDRVSRIDEVSDAALDRIAEMLIEPGRAGFWLAGHMLSHSADGAAGLPNPAHGHQRMWVPAATVLTLYYPDRPLHADPDRIVDDPDTVYL